MLQGLAEYVADAHIRAAEWVERSRCAPTERERLSCLRLGRAWSHVADNYEFIGSLQSFLLDMHEKGWPIRLENLPKPPHFEE